MPTKTRISLEGGALYFAPSSDSAESICFLENVELDIEETNKQDLEEFKLLKKDSLIDISSTRAWRRVSRIMRKARQKAKREWEKRKKTGRPLYDPETD